MALSMSAAQAMPASSMAKASLPMSALMRVVIQAGGFVDDDGFLAHASGDSDAGGDRFVGGMRRADNFDQLHFGDRVEEVHADAAFAVEDDIAEIADGERGRVAGEDGIGLGEFVEDGEEFEFHFEFFGNSFDD